MRVERLTSSAGELLNSPILLTPQVYINDRGYFSKSWNKCTFATLETDGQTVPVFVQDNHSLSSRSVLRGLHYQLPPTHKGN